MWDAEYGIYWFGQDKERRGKTLLINQEGETGKRIRIDLPCRRMHKGEKMELT